MAIQSTGLSGEGRSRSAGSQNPLTVTIRTACALSGLGQTKMFALIKDKRIQVIRLDGRTLIIFASLERLLSPAPDEQPAPRDNGRKGIAEATAASVAARQSAQRKRGRPRKEAARQAAVTR